jgi:tRNA A37 threonylcarbamoyladenosine synthetase subunit TsaC/SUA5/YrdC
MTKLDLPGVTEARHALAAGRVAILPNPTPLTYGVAAITPHAVNAAKGRPQDQAVSVWLHDDTAWQDLVPTLNLRPAALQTAFALLRRELVTLLVPLRDHSPLPDWLIPAVREGHALLYGGRWAPLTRLLADFPRLYASSANRTGHPPAATATQATTIFGMHVPVVDGDALRDLNRPHSPTTMLRIAPDGNLTLVRHGAQDTANGPDSATYLKRLHTAGIVCQTGAR